MVNCTTTGSYEDKQTTLINTAKTKTTSTTDISITTIFQETTRLIMNTENQTIKKNLTVSKALESTSSTTQQQTTMQNTIAGNTERTTEDIESSADQHRFISHSTSIHSTSTPIHSTAE